MKKRMAVLRLVLALCTLTLTVRLGLLSQDTELAQTATRESTLTLSLGPTRGILYDCKGNPLTDHSRQTVTALLPHPGNRQTLLESGVFSADRLSELLAAKKPLLLPGTLEVDDPFVTTLTLSERHGTGSLACHVVGYLQGGEGVSGLEGACNDYLKACSTGETAVTYTVNGQGRPLTGVLPRLRYAPPVTAGLILTLDSRIQALCEEIGSKLLKKGAIVVMEPATGKLRGVASFPLYPQNDVASVLQAEDAPLLNRAFQGYAVGSTFKVVTAAAAITAGLDPETVRTCTGSVQVGDRVFRCHEREGHGELTLVDALCASCNPYFIETGQQLPTNALLTMAQDLSFGKSSFFYGSYGSRAGTLPSLSEPLSPAALANLSFGQGALLATPVQLARMMSAVCNEGRTPAARLIEGTTKTGLLVDEAFEEEPPVPAMPPAVADRLRQALTACVMDTPGQNARPQYVAAGGKTGTAQTGQYDEDGNELLCGWFVGFFPAEDPRYVVSVLCEEARSGNQDAAPVFRALADALCAPLVFEP